MSLKGVIFDSDGVIVETVDLHFKAWKKMFSEYGKEFTFDDYKEKVDGIPRMDGARAILPDLPEDELRQATERKQRYFLELLEKEGVKKYEDTLTLINDLRQNSIKVAAISASKNCHKVLNKAGVSGLFEVIITGDDITKGKPDPQIFLLAKDRLKLNTYECVVFEDAVLGVEAAKRGNFKCIGVDRYNNPSRLDKADLVIDDLSKLNTERLKEIVG